MAEVGRTSAVHIEESVAPPEPMATAIIDGREAPILSVKDWIRLEHELFRNSPKPRMQPYDGPRDFVIQHGLDFTFRSLPKNVRRRPPRQCFYNAASLALRRQKEFLYAEGYTFYMGICLEHAWCVDQDGYVVDPTRSDAEVPQYFGVPFRHSYVRAQAQATKVLGGLINAWYGEERWPLCTGAHSVSDAIAEMKEWTGVQHTGGCTEGLT